MSILKMKLQYLIIVFLIYLFIIFFLISLYNTVLVLPYVFIHDSSSLHHYCVFLRKVSALYTTLLADDSSKHAMLVPPSLWRALTCLLTLPLFLSLLVENFGPRWPTEDGPEVLRKCHGQASMLHAKYICLQGSKHTQNTEETGRSEGK